MAKAVVNQDACVGCESCVGACPVSAISVNDGKASVDAGTCVEKNFYFQYARQTRQAESFIPLNPFLSL